MVDAILLFIVLMSFFSGLGRGLLRQVWALAVLALAVYMASHVYLNFTGLIGRFTSSDDVSKLASFVLTYGILSAVLNASMDMLVFRRREDEKRRPTPADQLSGGALGALEGIGSIQVGAAVLMTYPVLGWEGWITSSNVIKAIFDQIPLMMPLLTQEFQHVVEFLR
jgi:uncharacterized membrane protein required for colicin V production